MHEIQLGHTIQDYLSGTQIPATTYEDIRQEIARVLVEEKKVPRDRLQAKVRVEFVIDGGPYARQVDLVLFSPEGEAWMAAMFCAGEVETYARQTLAAARLLPSGPARLALVTDTRKALLLQAADGKLWQECAFADLPDWDQLQAIVAQLPAYTLTADKKSREERLFYALSEISCSCSDDSCSVPGQGSEGS